MFSLAKKLGVAAGLALAGWAISAWAESAGNEAWKSIRLIPFKDPWNQARQRFEDIDDFRFSYEFEHSFSYKDAVVTLSYNPAPAEKYFVGHIEAKGLKPNFAYQLKLVGKPSYGKRGWGNAGDDRANEAIGRATRWWNDTTGENTFDNYFRELYQRPAAFRRDTIYGYDFMGDFITDSEGSASQDFDGSKAYHITWQDKQSGHKDVVAGLFKISSLQAPYYGYGIALPEHTVKLWYEWQAGRDHEVKLPKGDYNCRFLISEETFHAVDENPKGGRWPAVLATEDFVNGKPDGDVSNDVRFVIR